MSLPYVLLSLGANQLRVLQNILQMKEGSKDRNHLALAIAERLLTKEGFLLVWNSLSSLVQRVYMAALFEIQADGYTMAIPAVRLLPTLLEYFPEDRATLQNALEQLVGVGMLSRAETWYVGEAYSLPEEMKEMVVPHIVELLMDETLRDANDTAVVGEINILERYGRMFIRDIARFTIYLTKYPLPLTKASIPYKRELPKLKSYLRTMQIEGIKGTGSWEAVPFGVVASIFVLEDMGVIDRSSDTVRLHGKALHRFLMMPDEELREQLMASLPRLVGGLHPHVMAVLSAWLRQLPQGEWLSLDRAIGGLLILQPMEHPPSWSNSLDHFIRIASACGLIEIGRHVEHGFLVRIPKWSDSVSVEFFVQPNLDILVPEEAPTCVHFLVGELAELKRADEMSAYHLTRDSVLLLCDRGWQMEDIERALTTFSATTPAKSVIRSVEDWVGAYDRAVLWDVLLLRFASADLFHAFVTDQRTKHCIVQRIAQEAVIVLRAQEAQVRQVLSELGAPPPQQVRMAPGEENYVHTKQSRTGSLLRKGTKEDQVALGVLTSPQIMEIVQKTLRA